MWRDDQIVQLEQRVVRRSRLLLEYVDRRSGDLAVRQRPVQGFLVDDRPARRVDEEGGRLHQRELARADQLPRLLVERAVHAHEVGFAQQRVQVHQLHAQRRHRFLRDIGIAGQVTHGEGHGEAEQFGADVAYADRTQHATGKTGAEMVHALVPAPLAHQAVLYHHTMREHEHESERGARHRAAHAIRRDGEQHAVVGEGRDVDRVVAHAEARDQLEPPVRSRHSLPRDLGQHHGQGVVLRCRFRRQLGFELGQKLPLDARVIQELE